MQNWDFNCPQFIDFEDGLQDNSPTDVWFENRNRGKKEHQFNRNGFGPRMATPKLKPIPVSKNSPYVNTNRPVKTDDEKLEDLCKFPFRRSRSFDSAVKHLETPKTNVKTLNGRRKRSLSENCNKIKKKITPTTPQCLKRTLQQVKSKNLKTTEELELEKISALQNKLLQHLRLNEANLKRIKMNKPPVPMKNFHCSNRDMLFKAREIKELNVPVQQLAGVKNVCRKTKTEEENLVEKSKTYNQNMKMKLNRLNAVLHSESKKSVNPSNVLRDLNSNHDSGKVSHKMILSSIHRAHSGLKFVPNQNKTIPHPFSFDSSSISSQSMSFWFKDTSKVLTSFVNKAHIVNKENIH